jgi:molybdate transport system substrate-binding protein
MIRFRRLFVGLAAAALTVPGCGKATEPADRPSPSPDDTGELVVLAGNSFLPPTEQLITAYTRHTGVKAVYTTGGSEDLLPHIKGRQKGDVFITHDPYLDAVRQAGAYADHVQVGFVAPVLAVQKGNPAHVTGLADLTRPGLKLALSNPRYSTCGEMVRSLLIKKHLYDEVMRNVDARLTKGHSNLGNLIKTQAVDAVIMWNGVATTFKEHLEVVKTPYEYDTEIGVHVISLGYSRRPEAARRFLVFVREKGREIFADNGYVK